MEGSNNETHGTALPKSIFRDLLNPSVRGPEVATTTSPPWSGLTECTRYFRSRYATNAYFVWNDKNEAGHGSSNTVLWEIVAILPTKTTFQSIRTYFQQKLWNIISSRSWWLERSLWGCRLNELWANGVWVKAQPRISFDIHFTGNTAVTLHTTTTTTTIIKIHCSLKIWLLSLSPSQHSKTPQKE